MGRSILVVILFMLMSWTAVSSAASPPDYDRGLAKAKALIKAGNFPAAGIQLKSLLKGYPDNAELLSMLARLLFWQQKHDAALSIYDKLLERRPSAALRKERGKVLVAKELDIIDRLQQSDNGAKAMQRLEELYSSGSAPYESGYRLASLYLQRGAIHKALNLTEKLTKDFPEDLGLKIIMISALLRNEANGNLKTAQSLLTQCLAKAPANHELLVLQGRLNAREGRYLLAVKSFDQALEIKADPALAAEREKASLACELDSSEKMAEQGDTAGAEAKLEELYSSGKGSYEAGYRLADLRMRLGLYGKALPVFAALKRQNPADHDLETKVMEAFILDAGVTAVGVKLQEMLVRQPSDPEIFKLSGRLRLWDHDYQGAVLDFQESLRLHPDEKVRQYLETAILLERLKDKNELSLQVVASNSTPELLRLQARYNFWKGRPDESLDLYAKLLSIRPTPEHRQEMEKIAQAAEAAESAVPIPRNIHGDGWRKKDRNWLKVTGEFNSYSKGMGNGKDFALELSRELQSVTIVPTLTNSSRFGKNNSQIGIDIYGRPVNGSIWGSVGVSVSPDADFLPAWSAGASLYSKFTEVEASVGFRHMDFPDSVVDLLVPGFTIYLPGGFSLDTRLYVARSQGAFSLSAAPGIAYEPSERWKTSYSVTAGRSAETISDSGREKIKLFTSIVQKAGCEYRYSSSIGLGAEITHTYRQALYNSTGVSIFTRLWW